VIVADSNVIAYLLIPGDHSDSAESVLRKDNEWIAPLLWQSEFRNILTMYMRHTAMTIDQAHATMDKAELLMSDREYAVNSDAVLELTSRTRLSAYDAEFVVLASQTNTKLVTTDRRLVKAASGIAISPQAFLAGHK
jgi:predicted nucleic acid-binding protein